MRPPVALLVYPPDEPERAAYYPFAEFSPEWVALRWAFGRGAPARFIDLPMAHQMALEEEARTADAKRKAERAAGEGTDSADDGEEEGGREDDACDGNQEDESFAEDPIGLLSKAAGYEDRELWWEIEVEQRRDARGLFAGILEVMAEFRGVSLSPAKSNRKGRGEAAVQEAPAPTASPARPRLPRREALREAFMRQRIRAAEKEGFERIAVVCGAWHTPALAVRGAAKADADLLRDLPKRKVASTWIPWTHGRLTFRSGYGAGVESPGWYRHLFLAKDRAPVRWVAEAARLLRAADLDASPASVIETVRLAEALAALRGHPMPGLLELREAILSVLCQGDAAPLALVRKELEVGERLGAVPEGTPAVPLQKDFDAQTKRLRLKPSAEIKPLDLDLREETGRERSWLLHRLRLLDVPWGSPEEVSGKAGTFHEVWRMQWKPELAVAIVAANVHGNTVAEAAGALAARRAREAADLPALTSLVDVALLANLPSAVETALDALQSRAAVTADVRHLMDALPPIARVARYGDVRGTRPAQLEGVVEGLFERILVGLPGACASLDDQAAESMAKSLGNVSGALEILARDDFRRELAETLARLADADGVHGRVRGRAVRLLLDQKALAEGELERRASLALSPGVPPGQAAAWVEGLVSGSGLALLHEDALWAVLDEWLSGLAEDAFREHLAAMRRGFSLFAPAERRQMGEKAKRLGRGATASLGETRSDMDTARAALVLPVLAEVLGVPLPGGRP